MYLYFKDLPFLLGLLLLVMLGCSAAGRLTASLTLAEQQRIIGHLQQHYKNLPDAFYAVSSLKYLGKEIGDADGVCKTSIENVDKNDLKSLYQLSEIVKTLNCKVSEWPLFSSKAYE